MRIMFKICQTVTGISMISQFHEFFNLFFWRVFATRPDFGTVVAVTDHTKAVEAVTAAKIASPTFAGTRRSEQARK
jgi:hypothetical protein